jgi:hypothetical protein
LACIRKDVESCQQILEDAKKMLLNVSVRNQHVTEKKKRAFQYIEKNLEDVKKMILNVLVKN